VNIKWVAEGLNGLNGKIVISFESLVNGTSHWHKVVPVSNIVQSAN
jgi:hypothetical protein